MTDSTAGTASTETTTSATRATAPSALGRLLESSLVKFVIVGGISGVVDLGSTLLFTFLFGLSDSLAKTFGFILGTLTAYMINRRWTFKAEPSVKRFIITMVTYLITYAVQVGLYKLSIPWLEGLELNAFWVRVFSFVIAQGVATILNFLIQRFIIFRATGEEKPVVTEVPPRA